MQQLLHVLVDRDPDRLLQAHRVRVRKPPPLTRSSSIRTSESVRVRQTICGRRLRSTRAERHVFPARVDAPATDAPLRLRTALCEDLLDALDGDHDGPVARKLLVALCDADRGLRKAPAEPNPPDRAECVIAPGWARIRHLMPDTQSSEGGEAKKGRNEDVRGVEEDGVEDTGTNARGDEP